jgi:hypothetical protein
MQMPLSEINALPDGTYRLWRAFMSGEQAALKTLRQRADSQSRTRVI